MADYLSDLRDAALLGRIKSIAGGNRVVWSAKDLARLRDEIRTLPETILRQSRAVEHKFVSPISRKTEATAGATADAANTNARNFTFTISTARIDLANDSIAPDGIDFQDFINNPVVLNAHDSTRLPIAVSSKPSVVGGRVLATAKFPSRGVLAAADEVRDAIRAKLVRGASIGFVPLAWSLSKNPGRPLGIDFHQIRLLEWSICAVPCNPDCLAFDPAAASKSAERQIEAQALAASARRSIAESDNAPLTRDERLAEARRLIRRTGDART